MKHHKRQEEQAHNRHSFMQPFSAIKSSPPNVWLTSFYGFDPENWGMLGFSYEAYRARFIRETHPGALVVVYGHKTEAAKEQRGQIIGIMQMTHQTAIAKNYMSKQAWDRKVILGAQQKWNFAVKAHRAWRVVPESYVSVDEFAPDTYSRGRSQFLGSYGDRLTAREANGLLSLALVETSVYAGTKLEYSLPAPAEIVYAPSKPGPVSQSGHYCKEAESEKSLYVLVLKGNENHLLGIEADGQKIYKVGFSKSPKTRCSDLNKALPKCAFEWEILRSNETLKMPLFPSSSEAVEAENKIKKFLDENGKSLGGEFFLAYPDKIPFAWEYATKID